MEEGFIACLYKEGELMNCRAMLPGIALVTGGLFLLVSSLGLSLTGAAQWLAGAFFLVWWWFDRKTWQLVAGALIGFYGVGASAGAFLAGYEDVVIRSAIALGFLLIYALGRKKTGAWPLYAGLALLAFAVQRLPVMRYVVPAALVLAGAYLTVLALRKPRSL